MDALLIRGEAPPTGAVARAVLLGDAVLVGSRADRARVRGLRDIKAAFRWIAAARALYVSSSSALGLRSLELKLWDEVGVNVRARSTWYIEIVGDEGAVLREAASSGAYALVGRGTVAAQYNRGGLEVLLEGDPTLRLVYVSQVLRVESDAARAWHEWLSSEEAQAAVNAWRLNGVQVFRPARDGQISPQEAPPRT